MNHTSEALAQARSLQINWKNLCQASSSLKDSIAEFGKMLAAILEPPATPRRRRPRSQAAKSHSRALAVGAGTHARESQRGHLNPLRRNRPRRWRAHAAQGAGAGGNRPQISAL